MVSEYQIHYSADTATCGSVLINQSVTGSSDIDYIQVQNDGIYSFDLSDLENREVLDDTYSQSLTLSTQIQYQNYPQSVK